jgi:HSP20 family protein
MAEKNTAMAPSRGEQQQFGWRRQPGWGGGPFAMLQRFADEMDRFFEDFGGGRRGGFSRAWVPDVEAFQRNNELVIRADLPGLKKDEVSVEVTDNAVVLHGERRQEHEEDREGLYRSERVYGSFYRAIPLPEGAMTDQAKANFRDGVLEITMPAPPQSRGRRLEIVEGTKR